MAAWKIWPIILYISMIWLNTDFFIPVLRLLVIPHASQLTISLIVLPIAVLELCYGYWFWGYWVRPRVGELEKIRKARKQLHQEGLLDRWIIDGILKVYHQTLDPENRIRGFINKWGIWFIWLIAVFCPPGIAARSSCAVILGLFRQKKNFIHLLLASAAHTLLVLQIWELILKR